jgi:ABC-type phosphate transport system permease subunit
MTEASAPIGSTGADPAAADQPSAGRATPLWLSISIAVVFGVFYAYDLWEAVGNLFGMNITADGLGVAITGAGWALLIAALVLPLLVFGTAIWLGRRRGPFAQVVLFLVGFALVQVLAADVTSFFELGGLDLS